MSGTYISELQIQINHIDARLKQIANWADQGQFSKPYTKQTKAEYLRLKERRKVIQQRIIDYEPPRPPK